jgi:hypothetical protein
VKKARSAAAKAAPAALIGALSAFLLVEAFCRWHYAADHSAVQPFAFLDGEPHPYCAFGRPSDPAPPKMPGEYRILLLGGSTAAGVGTPVPGRQLGARLERHLNDIGGAGRFRVIVGAVPDYNTTQEKNALGQHIFDKSGADMVLSVTGFNNLAKSLENGALGLPLNYPGWRWAKQHSRRQKRRLLWTDLLNHARESEWAGFSRALSLFADVLYSRAARAFHREARLPVMRAVAELADGERAEFLAAGAEFFEQDLVQMDAVARANGMEALFVLQPVLTLRKKAISEGERTVLAGVRDIAMQMAPLPVWERGQEELRRAAGRLRRRGVLVVDSTEFFDPVETGVFVNLMHMNEFGQDLYARRLAELALSRLRDRRIPPQKL